MIKEIFEKQLLKEYNKPRKKFNVESIKPSSLGSKCLRKLYYEYFKVEKDRLVDYKSAINFLLGSVLHEAVQSILSKSDNFIMWINPKTTEPEFEFVLKFEELNIKYAKLDGILIIDNKIWILEIKTKKAEKFYNLTGPDESHLFQGGAYHVFFEEKLKRGEYDYIPEIKRLKHKRIEGVSYLYINKQSETLEMKEFVVPRNDLLFQQVIEKCLTVKTYGDKKLLPPKTLHFCPWCDYKDKCKKNFNI